MQNDFGVANQKAIVSFDADVLDMSPDRSQSLLERLSDAAGDTAHLAPQVGQTQATARTNIERPLDRQERAVLTDASIGKVLEQLSFTSERLQGAMHRIGFLESQVEILEEQVKYMPELRAKAARTIVLERLQSELSDVVSDRNMQLVAREKTLDEKDQHIAILEKVIDAHRKHLTMVERDLEVLETNPWVRFWAWFSGFKLKNRYTP